MAFLWDAFSSMLSGPELPVDDVLKSPSNNAKSSKESVYRSPCPLKSSKRRHRFSPNEEMDCMKDPDPMLTEYETSRKRQCLSRCNQSPKNKSPFKTSTIHVPFGQENRNPNRNGIKSPHKIYCKEPLVTRLQNGNKKRRDQRFNQLKSKNNFGVRRKLKQKEELRQNALRRKQLRGSKIDRKRELALEEMKLQNLPKEQQQIEKMKAELARERKLRKDLQIQLEKMKKQQGKNVPVQKKLQKQKNPVEEETNQYFFKNQNAQTLNLHQTQEQKCGTNTGVKHRRDNHKEPSFHRKPFRTQNQNQQQPLEETRYRTRRGSKHNRDHDEKQLRMQHILRKKQREEELRQKQQEDECHRKKKEIEEHRRKKQEEEHRRKKQMEEEHRLKIQEEERRRKKYEEELRRRKQQEEERHRKQQQEERRRKQQEEEERRHKQEELLRQNIKKQEEEKKKKRRMERQRKADETVQNRYEKRKQEMNAYEKKKNEDAKQRAKLKVRLAPIVARRVQGKSYIQLCKEFCPKARLPAHPDRNSIRRTLRRARAIYHPDRSSRLPTLEKRVEAELIFQQLQQAYEEITQ